MSEAPANATDATTKHERDEDVHAQQPPPPLGPYLGLATTYLLTFGSAFAIAARARRGLPRRVAVGDIALLGVATHELTRVITRDVVASPLRAPFAEYQGKAGAGEVHERPRGRGLRRALGELFTCPYCAAPWMAAALFTGLVARPRETRMVASVLSAVAVSNFLNQAYAVARRSS